LGWLCEAVLAAEQPEIRQPVAMDVTVRMIGAEE